MKIIFSFTFLTSILFNQGMYIESNENEKSIYSLNIFSNSEFRENVSDNNYYGLSLSTVLDNNNELSLSYSKQRILKSYETYYKYYFRPQLPIKFNFSIFYELLKRSSINYNFYKVGIGTYLNFKGKDKNSQLKFYPFINYFYILNDTENIYYDIVEAGLSIRFNDIGIEPSYRFIANGAYDISFKIYLWEFSDY